MRTTEEGEFVADDISGRQSGYGRLMVVAVVLLIALTLWAVTRRGPKVVMRAGGMAEANTNDKDLDNPLTESSALPVRGALSAPGESNLPQYRPVTYFDPFPLLEQRYQKSLTEHRLRFDTAAEERCKVMENDLRTAYDEYLAEFEVMKRSVVAAEVEQRRTMALFFIGRDPVTDDREYRADLSAVQESAAATVRARQEVGLLYVNYQKRARRIKEEGRLAVEQIAVGRQAALSKLEADKTDRRIKLERIEAMIAEGRIDPIAAKQEQLRTLGISVPSSLLSSPGSAAEHQVRPEREAAFVGNGPPVVTAIFIGDHNRLCALAGGAFLYEGDMVNGCRVQKIHQNSVVFEKDGKTWVYGVQ